MCGIVGYFSKSPVDLRGPLDNALKALNKRGPDKQVSQILSPKVGLDMHACLSSIRLTMLLSP